MNEREIFIEALQRPAPADRLAYLELACGSDAGLRGRVEDLLAAFEKAGSFLQEPGAASVATADHRPGAEPIPPELESPGTTIGPYTLREQIGEGGMGVVYVAEQSHPVRRKVALKVIKPGMDTKQVVARFEAERQALAMMDHPNIAKVHDGGTTESGRPYFVMELVPGVPITEYCDGERLSVRQRLELFVLVCRAVQHAHQKGIIHRDLKPSNILVTLHDGVPVPKVIDFGVAKAMGQSLTEKTVYTALSQLVGTPLYMSPEQAEMNQLGVDTRSDVYSLGVLLYELLTGTTPFDKEALGGSGLEEMRRMIREDEPPRPSARVSTLEPEALSTTSQRRSTDPRRISAALHGELDWIVMKSLEKDRGRRYESAGAFATDIQRYLHDEPVLAGPPTTMYKFQKFARKHRAALATAVAIAASLIVGTTASAWQAVRATTAEAQANVNATQAEEKANEATAQRDEAQKQRDEVQALNEKLQATQAELRSTVYAAHMNVAQHAWDEADVSRVQDLLERHRPKGGERDLRRFEWYYLDRLCHSELLTFKGHRAAVLGVAFSPDSKRLASASADGTVKVWDAQTGQESLTFEGHKPGSGNIRSVAFSPDGKRLASFSNNEVKVWDAQTGQELHSLDSGSANYSSTVVFSPDGKRLASSSNQVKVWDAGTGELLLTLKRDRWGYFDANVVFSPDGKRLASGSTVWDAQTGEQLLTLKRGGNNVVFSPDGKRLASANRTWGSGDGCDVTICDAKTGQDTIILKGDAREGITGLAFSPDGKRLAGGSYDQTVRLWDAETGQQVARLKGHTWWIDRIAFSPDGKRLASASRDKTVKVWQTETPTSQEALTLKGGTSPVWGVAFSPDGKRLASASRGVGKRVKVWDAQTGQDLLTLEGHTSVVDSVAFSPDGKRLASSGYNEGKVWDAQSGEELRKLEGVTEDLWGLAFSPDGKRLAGAYYDNTVKVWDVQTGQLKLTLTGLPEFTAGNYTLTKSVAFSPDGKRLASAGQGQVVIWDAETAKELLRCKGAPATVMGVAYSSDGKRLASGHRGEVKLWDALTGEEILTLKGHKQLIPSVIFSPDGHRLASGSHDGTVKVWDTHTGQDTLTLTGHTDRICHLVFSPDGHRLVSNGSEGTVKIWDATPLPEEPQAKDKAP